MHDTIVSEPLAYGFAKSINVYILKPDSKPSQAFLLMYKPGRFLNPPGLNRRNHTMKGLLSNV